MRCAGKETLPGLVLVPVAKAVVHADPERRDGHGIETEGFQTFESLGDFGIGAVLCHCPRGHGFEQIHIAFLVEEATIVGTDAGWPSKSWSRGRGKLYGRTT